jgi:hypothetical protein
MVERFQSTHIANCHFLLLRLNMESLHRIIKEYKMYTVLCDKCHGTGEYECPCQCFADYNCTNCHGMGYYFPVCNKCEGTGMIVIKQNKLNDNEMRIE